MSAVATVGSVTGMKSHFNERHKSAASCILPLLTGSAGLLGPKVWHRTSLGKKYLKAAEAVISVWMKSITGSVAESFFSTKCEARASISHLTQYGGVPSVGLPIMLCRTNKLTQPARNSSTGMVSPSKPSHSGICQLEPIKKPPMPASSGGSRAASLKIDQASKTASVSKPSKVSEIAEPLVDCSSATQASATTLACPASLKAAAGSDGSAFHIGYNLCVSTPAACLQCSNKPISDLASAEFMPPDRANTRPERAFNDLRSGMMVSEKKPCTTMPFQVTPRPI